MRKSEMGRGNRSLPPHHDAGGHGQPMGTEYMACLNYYILCIYVSIPSLCFQLTSLSVAISIFYMHIYVNDLRQMSNFVDLR
jgi:hypothetical protein